MRPGLSPAPLPHMFNNQSDDRYTVRNEQAMLAWLSTGQQHTVLVSYGYGLYGITDLVSTLFGGVLYKVQTNVINAV